MRRALAVRSSPSTISHLVGPSIPDPGPGCTKGAKRPGMLVGHTESLSPCGVGCLRDHAQSCSWDHRDRGYRGGARLRRVRPTEGAPVAVAIRGWARETVKTSTVGRGLTARAEQPLHNRTQSDDRCGQHCTAGLPIGLRRKSERKKRNYCWGVKRQRRMDGKTSIPQCLNLLKL